MNHSADPPPTRQQTAELPGGGERDRRFQSAVSLLPIGGGGLDGRRAGGLKVDQSASNPPQAHRASSTLSAATP